MAGFFWGFSHLKLETEFFTDICQHGYNSKKKIVHCIYRFTRCLWLASCLLCTWNTLTLLNIDEFSTLSSSLLMNCPKIQGLSTQSVLPASIKLLVLRQMSQNTAGINTPSASTGPMAPKIWHSNVTHMHCNAISLRPKAALPPQCYILARSRDRF